MDDSFAILRLVTLAPKRHIAMTEPDYVVLKTCLEVMVGKSADPVVKKALKTMFDTTARVKVGIKQYMRMVGMVFEAGEDDNKIETSAGEILSQGVSATAAHTGAKMLSVVLSGPRKAMSKLRRTVFVNGQNMWVAIAILFMIRLFVYNTFQDNTVEGIKVGKLNTLMDLENSSSGGGVFADVFFSDVSVYGAGKRIYNGINIMQRYQSFIDELVDQTSQSGFLNDVPVFQPLKVWAEGMSTEEASQNIARALTYYNRRGRGDVSDRKWFNGLSGPVRKALNRLGEEDQNGQVNPYYDLFDSMRVSRDRGLPEAILEQNAAFSTSIFYQRFGLAMARLYGRYQGWDGMALETVQGQATELVKDWLGGPAGGDMISKMVSQYFNEQLVNAAEDTARYDSMLTLSIIASVYGVAQFCMNTYRTFTNPRGVFDRSNAVNWYQMVINSSLAMSQVLNLGVLVSLEPQTAIEIMTPRMIQGQITAQATTFLMEELVMYLGGYRNTAITTNTIAATFTITVARLYGAGSFVAGGAALIAGGGSIGTIALMNLKKAAGQPLGELEDVNPGKAIMDMVEEEEPASRRSRSRSPKRSAPRRSTRQAPRRRYIPTGSEMLLRQTLNGNISSKARVRANEIIFISAKVNAIVQTHIDSLEELDMKEEARLLREAKELGPQALWEFYEKRSKKFFKEAKSTDEEVDQFIEYTKRLYDEELLLSLKEMQETEPRFFESAEWTEIDPDDFEKELDQEYARGIEELKERNGGVLDKKELEELNEIFSIERDMLLDEYLEANKDEEWDSDYPVLEEWAEMVRYKSPYSDYLKSKARERRVAKAKKSEKEFKDFEDMMDQWDRDTKEIERKIQEVRERELGAMEPEKLIEVVEAETPLAVIEDLGNLEGATQTSPLKSVKRMERRDEEDPVRIKQYEQVLDNKWFINQVKKFNDFTIDRLVKEGKLRVRKGSSKPPKVIRDKISELILVEIKQVNDKRLKLVKKAKTIKDWKSDRDFLKKMAELVVKLDQILEKIKAMIEKLAEDLNKKDVPQPRNRRRGKKMAEKTEGAPKKPKSKREKPSSKRSV